MMAFSIISVKFLFCLETQLYVLVWSLFISDTLQEFLVRGSSLNDAISESSGKGQSWDMSVGMARHTRHDITGCPKKLIPVRQIFRLFIKHTHSLQVNTPTGYVLWNMAYAYRIQAYFL
jgi:hypothetical protein